jgi:hypothetical protein
MRVQIDLGTLKDAQRQQRKFIGKAESIIGPQSTWPSVTDGIPALAVFQGVSCSVPWH